MIKSLVAPSALLDEKSLESRLRPIDQKEEEILQLFSTKEIVNTFVSGTEMCKKGHL